MKDYLKIKVLIFSILEQLPYFFSFYEDYDHLIKQFLQKSNFYINTEDLSLFIEFPFKHICNGICMSIQRLHRLTVSHKEGSAKSIYTIIFDVSLDFEFS